LTINIIVDKKNINSENVKKLQGVWINILPLAKRTMHSKAILIDFNYLFIWSVNFSEYSLDKNREIGILIKEEEIIEKWKEIFKN
jgi:phosphatidylserine/phosphatidylglycerophosphate/cardiolipin synthase-like enzyme